jgi:hypothetical protein
MVDEHAKEAARGPEDSMNPLAPRRLTNAPVNCLYGDCKRTQPFYKKKKLRRHYHRTAPSSGVQGESEKSRRTICMCAIAEWITFEPIIIFGERKPS